MHRFAIAASKYGAAAILGVVYFWIFSLISSRLRYVPWVPDRIEELLGPFVIFAPLSALFGYLVFRLNRSHLIATILITTVFFMSTWEIYAYRNYWATIHVIHFERGIVAWIPHRIEYFAIPQYLVAYLAPIVMLPLFSYFWRRRLTTRWSGSSGNRLC